MIKANELRIGNILKANGIHEGAIKKFKRLHEDLDIAFFSDEGIAGEYLSDCDPIPLTPEILVDAGFEKAGVTFKINEKYILWLMGIDKNSYAFMLFDERDDSDEIPFKVYSTKIAEIEFVHQLQNLYFALLGQELQLEIISN